jgi:peptidoglycan/LPS O-acetylase OafA/YrhL
LRAYGVVLVLIYHFYPALLPAGFLGVDVFFVFSGYLITSLLVREFQTTGHVDLLAFYKRRVRRLLPAIIFMLLVILPLSLLVSPDFRAGLAQQTAAVLSWVTNFYEIANGQSYANRLLPHFFTHTWTLSIEMQYYLIWGALLCAVLPLQSVLRTSSLQGAFRSIIVLIAFIGTALSFLAMQLLLIGADDPSSAYYNTLSHLYPLLIGSAVGALAGFSRSPLVKIVERIKPSIDIALTTLCLLGITAMAAMLSFDNTLIYHAGILLTAILVAVVIVLGRGMQKRLAKYPEPKLPLYLANTSYSLYLFHWPLYIIIGQKGQHFAQTAPSGFAPAITIGAGIIALALTFFFAHISYRFVEKPFSSRGKGFAQSAAALRAVMPRIPPALIAGFVSVALMVGCVVAVKTAPAKTSIEQTYQYGSMMLDIGQLDSSHAAFDQIAQQGADSVTGLEAVAEEGSNEGDANESVYMPGKITIIGDSVTLDAADPIQKATGAYIDAAVGRSMRHGVSLIAEMEQEGQLDEYVVIALATNTHADSLDAAYEIIENMEPGHRLIFVTAYGVGHAEMSNLSANLRVLPSIYPFVTIADWNSAIADKEDLLAADGYHCRGPEARSIYTQVIVDAIRTARSEPTT